MPAEIHDPPRNGLTVTSINEERFLEPLPRDCRLAVWDDGARVFEIDIAADGSCIRIMGVDLLVRPGDCGRVFIERDPHRA